MDNGQKAPNPQVTISISWDQVTGAINVNGAIQNEMVAMYLLEKAKDAVKAFAAAQASEKRITPATFLPQIVKH